MSIIENILEQAAASTLKSITKPQSLDLGDDTFAKLLQAQLNAQESVNSTDLSGQLGMPNGFVIEPLDGSDTTINTDMNTTSSEFEIKDMKIGDYFSDMLKGNNELAEFAIKHAANSYSKFNKGLIDNLEDFVGDVVSSS